MKSNIKFLINIFSRIFMYKDLSLLWLMFIIKKKEIKWVKIKFIVLPWSTANIKIEKGNKKAIVSKMDTYQVLWLLMLVWCLEHQS